ncbi:glycoside hydrolase family 2 TIM barrel-domain containing protein [Lutibacter sp. TH_r2]|uniref:glycoside hydrolase family 2 protein n=1 Tax=Lutibacter sp. TH_r2 TaxID=3082083 RepID=UPI0029540D18|nr:glycoside hydrolase family 2 TIM barrel-domain containing protein [Lutibacter sp. TH_r2]MDV7185862.1 glycoside hydrolase family 2 TIM barrel-domain containing protein [Lutibacter sp. TH_r2]
MNFKHFKFLLIFTFILNQNFAQNLPFGFPKTDRAKLNLNQDWKFHLGNPEAKNYEVNTNDSNWESVTIPHTLKLTSLTLDGLEDDKTQLIFHREVGWYRRNIEINNTSKKIFLEFEGAHQVTDLWVNGKHVGQFAVGGYSPFHFDITNFVNKGNNQITLLVDNRRNEVIPPDPGPFDYVKFSGLYRDVYLVETNPVHVTFNWETLNSGVNITTPTIDVVNKNAVINIKTSVKNENKTTVECQLITRIINQEGLVVLKLVNSSEIKSQQEFQFNQIGSLEDDVHFWDTENPYLYRVNSVVKIDNKQIDFVENKIGLRKFELDPVRGFILNNKPIKLIGANRHQQFPYIGDAVPNSLHYKDMLQFKEFGFNMVRTAHYPHDNALIDACDELGILVYEEAPTWVSISQNNVWWNNLEKAARILVRNHRNHPSIVMWGAGVNHRGYVPRIHNTIKQEDPTRLTASQSARWTGWQTSGLTDINANMLYGPFIWDRTEPMFAMEGRHGPAGVAPYKRDPLMTGIISWTAHAYYTFHPTHARAKDKVDRTRSGMMTIFRYPRPELDWYKTELKTEPFVKIVEDWKKGIEEVTVYSNAPEVSLLLNGKLIEKSKPSADTSYVGLDHAPFHFKKIKYEKGNLIAKAHFKNGKTLETKKSTAGKAYALELKIDSEGRTFVADNNDIILAYATVIDKNGNIVSDFKEKIKFSVKGDASIIGDNANINANPMFTEYGVAPALVKAGKTTGEIIITAKSKGLKSASSKISLVKNNTNEIEKHALPIYDFTTERVDLGAKDQLLQFGWNAWNGNQTGENSYSFKNFKGVTAKILNGSNNGVIRWLGEMNVIGKYGFAYGDGIISIDSEGFNLELKNLPKGIFKLKSWHHAPRTNSDLMDPNKEKMQKLQIHKLPYEKQVIVTSKASINKVKVISKVTEGKQMQWDLPGTSEIIIESDGINPVIVNFNGNGNKGIWFNAFELSNWK